ncbi:DUF3761 domain-containing protein [Streptomyces sp. NPDC090082]|uniref:DUF3761 domain-containing protein n=1 Tax=unclassified Streptomyces TaxID=2593676 RepID=UPI00382C1DC9
MTHSPRPRPSAEDRKNFRVGCGFIVALLLAVGGCGALLNDDTDTSSAPPSDSRPVSTSSSVDDGAAATVTVGDFVGMELQAAQDAAQADGVHHLDSTDATGQGRQQFLDSNWTVCSQEPAAGARMSVDDTLTFDTVKSSAGETCEDPTGVASTDVPGTDDTSTVSGTGDDSGDGGSSADSGTGSDAGADASSNTSGSSTGSSTTSSNGSSSAGSDSGSSSAGSDSGSSSSSDDSPQAPAGATAQCNDGSFSYSAHRRGTCSHHGGVAVWLAGAPS